MGFLPQWLALVSIFGLAVMSPGPNFIVAVRNSALYSRGIGLMTALGLACGTCVHLFYTVAGLAAIIASSAPLFTAIKIAGACYLFYIGYKALRSTGFEMPDTHDAQNAARNFTLQQAWRSGFLTELLNPKATLFCLAVFTQFIGAQTPFGVQIFYAFTCVAMVWGWFSFVTLVMTQAKIKALFIRCSRSLDRVCGILFIALGIRLVLAKGPS